MDPTFKAALRKGLIGFVISRICVLGGAAVVAAQEVVTINDAKGVRPANASKLLMNVFAVRPDGRYMGLVTGLREGSNILTIGLQSLSRHPKEFPQAVS